MRRYTHDFDDWEQFIGAYNLVAYRAVVWKGEEIIMTGFPVSDKAKAETDANSFREDGYNDVEILGIWMTTSGKELVFVEIPE